MGNHQNFCYRDSGDLTDQIIENNLNHNQTISTKEAQNISTNGCEPIHPSFERSVQDSYYKKQQIGPYMKVEVSNSLVTKQCIWKEVLSKKNIQQWKDIENSLPSESSDQIQYEGKLDSLLRQIQLEDKLFFKELIQQGPPNNRLRWSSWKLFLMNEYYIKLYSICDHYEDEAVMKDVKRTLTNVKYFNSMIEGISEGQQKLQNVLLAINYVLPDLGYCQGMNFIAGFLLLISGGKEDQTFACFQKLMLDQNFLLYFMFHQELELFQLLEYIYNQELEDAFPILSQHLKKVQIENSFWITKCFLTLFLYSFKLESCLRIWDYIVTQGVFYSISILLSFIQFYQTELLNICSIDQFISWFEQFQTVPLPTQVYSDSYKYSILNKDIKEYAKIFYKQKKSSPFLRAMKKYPLLDDFIVEHVKIRII